jgi:hypothetical protein
MFLLHLRQALTTLVLSTLEPAPESPGGFSRRNVFFSDLIQNPRNGELLVLGSAAQETTVHRFHSVTLEPLGPALDVGSNAVDMELVP